MNEIIILSTVKKQSSVDQSNVPKLFVYISTLMYSIKSTIHKTQRVQKFLQTKKFVRKRLTSWVPKTICAITKMRQISAVNMI